MINPAEISKMAHHLGLGDKTIEKDYVLTWVLNRTEPRDLYDIHYLLTNRMVDVEQASFSASPKFAAKGLAMGDLRTVLERRQATFQPLWQGRLSGQMPEIPDLEDVIRETNRAI